MVPEELLVIAEDEKLPASNMREFLDLVGFSWGVEP